MPNTKIFEKWVSVFQLFVLAPLAGWLIFNLFQTIHLITADYSLIPIMDYWRVPQMWASYESSHWSTFWAQHNEHRIVFPELFYVADMFLLHGRMYLPIAVSGLCYFGVWVVILWAAYSQKAMLYPAREVAVLLAGMIIAWKGCSSVISLPFQLQFTLLQLISAIAFVFLAKLAEDNRMRDLVIVAAGGIVVNYSSANGILIWVALVGVAMLLRITRQRLLALMAVGAVSASAFFFRYHFLPSAIGNNVKHPFITLKFLCCYLSMPFGSLLKASASAKLGAINLLLFSGCFIVAWRRKLLRSRLGVLLFGTYFFTLLTAILTALGRMDLNDFDFNIAKAPRYVTVPTVAWALLPVALIWVTSAARSTSRLIAMTFVIAGLFAWGCKRSASWVEETRQDFKNAQTTAIMMQNDVFDPDQVTTDFPVPEFVRIVGKMLKDNHRSIFLHGDDKWIGKSAKELLASSPAAGAVTRVYPVPGGLELIGWAETAALTRDHAVLFVDNDDKIVGFGKRPTAGLPLNLTLWDTPKALTFVGFVSLKEPVNGLYTYVRTSRGNTFHPIGAKIEIPTFTLSGKQVNPPPIPTMTWQHDPAWTPNGFFPAPDNGPSPAGQIWGSWSGSDTRTGRIQSDPIAVPPNHCVIQPVLHGRGTYRQSAAIFDADSNQLIAKFPMLDERSIWERWRVPIPEATHNIRVEADDQGTGFGQWVAIGNPALCQ